MTVNFLGLTGPSGVLRHIYTLLLIERRLARDRRLQAFRGDPIVHRRVV
jgi:predicted component of type VI protein secretion system